MNTDTTGKEFFERMYQAKPDPWSFATSRYEQGRYETIAAALDHRRYMRAFEPGCSIGSLTMRLARMCDSVDAMDIAPSAVSQARGRCRELKNVQIACDRLPNIPFQGNFDLVVLSEIGYYLEEDELHRIAAHLVSRLAVDGVLLGAHWLGASPDHVLSGDRVHEILSSLQGISLDHSERHIGFRLDRWVRT